VDSESAGKTYSLTSEPINIGCLNIRVPISSQYRGGLIVDHNEQNIWLGTFCVCGSRKKKKQRNRRTQFLRSGESTYSRQHRFLHDHFLRLNCPSRVHSHSRGIDRSESISDLSQASGQGLEVALADILLVDDNPSEDISILGAQTERFKAPPREPIETPRIIMKDACTPQPSE